METVIENVIAKALALGYRYEFGVISLPFGGEKVGLNVSCGKCRCGRKKRISVKLSLLNGNF